MAREPREPVVDVTITDAEAKLLFDAAVAHPFLLYGFRSEKQPNNHRLHPTKLPTDEVRAYLVAGGRAFYAYPPEGGPYMMGEFAWALCVAIETLSPVTMKVAAQAHAIRARFTRPHPDLALVLDPIGRPS